MHKQTSFVAAATAAFVCLAPSLGCDPVQPKPYCRVQPSRYAVRYAVDGAMTGNCTGKVLSGEVVHMNFYRNKDNYADGQPSVGIEPDSMAVAAKAMTPPTGTEYSLGKFLAAKPDDNDLCRAPELSEAKLTGMGVDLSYKWSDFRMLIHPLFNAINWGANVERKDGDCVVKYKATGVYPLTWCGDGTKQVVNEMGMTVTEPDPTTGKANPKACEPVLGSGLSPDIEYKCDANDDGTGSHLCLAVKDFPSRK